MTRWVEIPCKCAGGCSKKLYAEMTGGVLYLHIIKKNVKSDADVYIDKEGIKQLLKILQEG